MVECTFQFLTLKNVRRLKRRCLVSEVTEDKGVKIFEYDGSEYFNFPKLRSLKDLIVRKMQLRSGKTRDILEFKLVFPINGEATSPLV